MTRYANKMSIREFLTRFDAGEFDDPSRETQIKAGWYDWFCSEEKLAGKTRKLVKHLKQLLPSKYIDQDKNYVWFKNNCPMVGPLYDDFRIADIETGDMQWTIVPKCTHAKGGARVFCCNPRKYDYFQDSYIGHWSGAVEFFKPKNDNVMLQIELNPNEFKALVIRGRARKTAVNSYAKELLYRDIVKAVENTPDYNKYWSPDNEIYRICERGEHAFIDFFEDILNLNMEETRRDKEPLNEDEEEYDRL